MGDKCRLTLRVTVGDTNRLTLRGDKQDNTEGVTVDNTNRLTLRG